MSDEDGRARSGKPALILRNLMRSEAARKSAAISAIGSYDEWARNRDPLDPTRKFSEGGAPEHRAALRINCPSCGIGAGKWCPMPGTTWNLCGARIDAARPLAYETPPSKE